MAVRYGSRKIYENMPYSFADDVVLEEDHETYLGTYARLHEGERFVSCDYRIKGTEIWSRVSLYRVNMDSPLVEGIVQDVSDHYNHIIAQAEENESEKRRLELQTLQLLNGITDAYDMVISANLTQNKYRMISYERYLNHSAKNEGVFDELIEVGTNSVPNAYKESFKESFSREALLGKYREGKRDVYLEHQQYDDNGNLHWVATHVIFTDNPMNNDVLEITLSQNIDERIKKETENQLALQNALQTAKMANEAKSDFLSSMSHDIRTPMNAIVGLTNLAAQHLDDAVYMRNCLDKMVLASNHLLTLINDILDISKVESGKMTLNPTIFSLADTVTNLTNLVKQQIRGKNQKFDVRVHNITKEYLFADKLRLNQIFINILSNAFKYTPEGGYVSIDLIEEDIPDAPNMVRLIYIVKDNGIGMSDEFQRNMFDYFSRANSEKYGEIQGSGLGLTISKRMVDLMGGTITCESKLNIGTTFTVTLELPIEEKDISGLVLPKMRLLLVDDDEVFLSSASNTLKQMGVTTECAKGGREAVRMSILRRGQINDYHAIVIDWEMPELSGIETIRLVREVVGENVPIIVASAYDWQEIEALAMEAGANGFVSKPFFISKVYENLTQILNIKSDFKKEGKPDNWQPDVSEMRVLVAEDNNMNWEIVSEVLKIYNVSTVRAENGQQCIDILKKSQDGEFDLILMDVKMPILNGYDASKRIRRDKREYIRNIPIIALTADAFAEDIQRCTESGINAHVSKPLDIRDLVEIMDVEFHKKLKTRVSNNE